MLRRHLTAIAVFASLIGAPAHAQLRWTVAGGATLPLGDYDEYAGTGWMVTTGLMKSVGDKGFGLGGQIFYGDNPHSSSEVEGDKSTLYGLLGTVRWRLGDAAKPGVFFVGNVGYMTHRISSELFPALEGAEDGVAYGGGVGLDIPRGKYTLYLVARYLNADVENATTTLAPIMLGISIPLGTK